MKITAPVSPDSCYLTLTDREVLSGCSLQVRPPSWTAGTGEAERSYPLFGVDGRTVEGRSAFYYDQDRGVFVDVMPSSFEPGRVDFKVHFSVPRIASGGRENYHGTDRTGTERAMSDVEKYLREIGIATNLKAARLNRLDTFRNVQADEPFASYRPVLSLLKGARMEEREYPDGFLWKNSQWQVCVYDKLEEMKAKKVQTKGVPSNSIRFEKRLTNSRKIKSASGLVTVADLLDGFDVLQPDYEKAMRGTLFKVKPQATPAMTIEEAEAGLRYFKEQGKRYWMDDWLNAFAMSAIADLAPIEIVTQAVENVAGHRMASNRMKKKLEQLHLNAAALKAAAGRRTFGDLYWELRAKVLDEPLRMVA